MGPIESLTRWVRRVGRGGWDAVWLMGWGYVARHQAHSAIFFGEVSERFPLSLDQHAFLQMEMSRAKACLVALLHTKCDYWLRLPWVIAGAALVDESAARTCGHNALAAFQRDPRPPPIQDALTWRLLKDGAPFRRGLELFLSGTPEINAAKSSFASWLCLGSHLLSKQPSKQNTHGLHVHFWRGRRLVQYESVFQIDCPF